MFEIEPATGRLAFVCRNAAKGMGTRMGKTGKRQGGATAVEFALVFPLFFVLFYGSLMYGLIFLMRMSLQHAAEDGVRAALRYQTATYPNGATAQQKRAQQIQARVAYGSNVASTQAGWMAGWQAPTVAANVCLSDVECLTPGAPATYPDCNSTTRCQIVITVTYPYATKPAIPTLPGFGLLAPTSLQGRARVLIDGRALATL